MNKEQHKRKSKVIKEPEKLIVKRGHEEDIISMFKAVERVKKVPDKQVAKKKKEGKQTNDTEDTAKPVQHVWGSKRSS